MMDEDRLDRRLISQWRAAAEDLRIRVTAPVELKDADGSAFMCEALVHDFGSATGWVVMSRRTERRIRPHVRSLGPAFCYSLAARDQRATYCRATIIDELEDLGWFGPVAQTPNWYVGRYARTA